MIEIAPANINDKLKSFFILDNVPGNLRFFAVLQEDNRGRLWIDSLENPTWGIIQESAYGTIHLQGSFPDTVLMDFIHDRRQQGEVLYGFWEDQNAFENRLPPTQYDGRVWESDQRLSSVDLNAFVERLPENAQIRPIDAELFPRIDDYQFYSEMFGSPEQALAKGFGFCIVQGEAILCEAFAGTSYQGVIEIGVNTREEHRRKGYATAACAAVIREAEQRGYRTYWNCAAQNVPSVALAQRLGFAPMKQYRLWAWF